MALCVQAYLKMDRVDKAEQQIKARASAGAWLPADLLQRHSPRVLPRAVGVRLARCRVARGLARCCCAILAPSSRPRC
jgi:hypothetical protein